jgi:hypothetical protein
MLKLVTLLGRLGYLSCCGVLLAYVFVPFWFSEVEHKTPYMGYITGFLVLVGFLVGAGIDIAPHKSPSIKQSIASLVVLLIAAFALYILGLSRGLFGGFR